MPSRTVHDGGEPMDEERRQERVLEALECLAADVERVRLLGERGRGGAGAAGGRGGVGVAEAGGCLAADVERLRLLREHELGVRVVPDEEGNLLIRPVGEGKARRTTRAGVSFGVCPSSVALAYRTGATRTSP